MKKLLKAFGFHVPASTTVPVASTMKEYIVDNEDDLRIIFDMFYGFIFRRTENGILYIKCSDKEKARIENSGNHITLTLSSDANSNT